MLFVSEVGWVWEWKSRAFPFVPQGQDDSFLRYFLLRERRLGLLFSHPFAKSAKGWGTRVSCALDEGTAGPFDFAQDDDFYILDFYILKISCGASDDNF